MMVDIASSMGTSNSGSVPVSDASRQSRAHNLNRDGPYGLRTVCDARSTEHRS